MKYKIKTFSSLDMLSLETKIENWLEDNTNIIIHSMNHACVNNSNYRTVYTVVILYSNKKIEIY